MKRIITIFTCLIAVAWAEPDWHTFTSADGSKEFAGKLVSFRKQGELVTVKRKDTNRSMSFKLSILSEEDQKLIREQASALNAAGAVRLSFDKNLERLDDDKVVKTEATRDEYIRKYGSLFGSDGGDDQAKN